MNYIVTIEETISKDFEIKAKNKEKAIEKAIQKYKDCEFVLDGDSCVIDKKVGIDGEFEEF